ncbi:flavodoxin [Salipaludibacillus sp. LMS25]|jgi:flavodoxin I|uniref:flavodoxin n=1 Tax=Salipaludibacillus sp. LMS25 TaxID=2924031 RepID=UPI0020D076EE|nr:flavodoxin [Salipaludibacillus sp. LMS25]UTR13305.1 flavodoxin [Salipaludibacillus sp. LMS25]
MSKVLLVFASMTGNTEEMADIIEKGLTNAGLEVDKQDVMDTEASEMADYSYIILGAFTWGDGELPDDFLDFHEEMEEMDLSGKSFAIFGSGDTAYEVYCGAVTILEDTVKERGGQIVTDSLKVELFPDDEDICLDFANKFAQAIGQKI